jgi:hypothetical protein
MKNLTLAKFVVNISISCSIQKIGSTSMGHPQEYIILPSADKTLDFFVDLQSSLQHFQLVLFGHSINTIEFGHLAKHSYVEIKVKTHYVVHKMLSQGNFCMFILNFVINNMIKYS